MSSDILKNWQKTACTVTNTADNKHIHLSGRTYGQRYKQRKGTFLYKTLKSFIYFLLTVKMQQIKKLRLVNSF